MLDPAVRSLRRPSEDAPARPLRIGDHQLKRMIDQAALLFLEVMMLDSRAIEVAEAPQPQ